MTTAEPIALDIPAIIGRFLNPGRLDRYFDLLMAENAKVNLVSRETSRSGFDQMVAESLLPLTVLDQPIDGYLDIGSGGGLPAVPLMLSGKIDGQVTLCERTQKKAAALAEILVGLGLKAEILPSQFLDLKFKNRFDLITLRYVKLDPRLLVRVLSVLTPRGTFLYYSDPEFNPSKCTVTRYKFIDRADSITKSFTLFRRS